MTPPLRAHWPLAVFGVVAFWMGYGLGMHFGPFAVTLWCMACVFLGALIEYAIWDTRR